MWRDECASLPPGSKWVEAVTRVAALSSRTLTRRYAVLDNSSVQAAVAHPEVTVIADKVGSVRGRTVTLASGRVLAAAVVVNATGPRAGRTEQTAFGVVLPSEVAAPLVAPGEAVFMDWRGSDGSTFLYAVPLVGDRVLVEETSLARRPGLGVALLRARLLNRLAAHGISPSGTTESVRIPLDQPVPARRAGVITFGAAAALVHPASGYSVAESFRLAPHLAEAIATEPSRAGRVLWSPAARAVHALRGRGLAVLLRLGPRTPEFFELFFDLSPELQRRYLSGREDLAGTAAAMAAIFRAADWAMRAAIVRSALVA